MITTTVQKWGGQAVLVSLFFLVFVGLASAAAGLMILLPLSSTEVHQLSICCQCHPLFNVPKQWLNLSARILQQIIQPF